MQTRPNKIMLIGWTCNDTTQDNTELLFITVDTLGNELNRVVWGGGGTDFMSAGVVVDEVGSVIMAGYTKSFPFVSNNIRTWVIKTDSVGNVKWHKTYTGALGSGSSAARIVQIENGNLIVAGGSQTFGNSSFGVDGTLMEIDTAGNQIWAKEYEVVDNQGLWGVVGLNDGTIVSCGVTVGNSGSQAGWLIKTDENGDTLWTRTYDSSDLIDYLRNMIVMPNGDIVMVGHGRAPGQTNQDGWILRVDSMGCLVENCFSVGIEEQLEERFAFEVYPNPAAAELYLKFVPSVKLFETRVNLTDMLGRSVLQITPTRHAELIDVSSLSNGTYLVAVINSDGLKQTQLVQVQH